jgi:hypothetical protein
MRSWLSLAALALTLPQAGCCSLARLFCGPDRTPWVSVDYSTPERAVRTLLEALRRDEPEIVYLSLTDDCRREMKLDNATVKLIWPEFREQNPYLHVAGYAEVPPVTRTSPDRAEVVLDIEGHRLQVRLRRELFRGLRWTRTNGTPADPGDRPETMQAVLRVDVDDEGDTPISTIAPSPWQAPVAVPIDALEFAGIEAKWRIDALKPVDPNAADG